MGKKIRKIVLAYSGGLDTSVILPWLKEKYDCKVIAFAADVGQGKGELDGIEEKALASGAEKCIVADLRKEFAEKYCFKMLQASAVYESVCRPRFGSGTYEHVRSFIRECVKVGIDVVVSVVDIPEIDIDSARRVADELGVPFRVRGGGRGRPEIP